VEETMSSHKDHYPPDKGCSLYPSCLNCLLPKCILDEPRVGVTGAKKRIRNEEIRERFYKGESVSDLAVAFGVCNRTIQGVVKKGG